MALSRLIPRDIEKFYSYITNTDDCQAAIDAKGFIVYPVDAHGKADYNNKEGQQKIINRPAYIQWNWTEDESRSWSGFRKEYEALYSKFERADKAGKANLKIQLDKIISDCIAYDTEHDLIDHIALSERSTHHHIVTFGIKQDVLEHKTHLRTIRINYDAQQPFTPLENKYVKKYIALHELLFRTRERINTLRESIRSCRAMQPGLWQQLPVVKDKADKVTNTFFVPPSRMKGAFPEPVIVKMPTESERLQRTDDYNKHIDLFQAAVANLNGITDQLFSEIEWAYALFEDEAKNEYHELFDEVSDLNERIFKDLTVSLQFHSLLDDFDAFLQSEDEVKEEITKANCEWADFINEQNLFINIYNTFVLFMNDRLSEEDEPDEMTAGAEKDKGKSAEDDIRAETVRRYESNLNLNADTYYDPAEWLIIIDHYTSNYNSSGKTQALKQAMIQHPCNAALLIRKAQDETSRHEYQKALASLKQAEAAPGGREDYNLLFVKANIFCQLQTPELAIPIYKQMTEQKGKERAWWRSNAYECLLEIYEKKKKYDECIRLCNELIAEQPENERFISNLGRFYFLNKKSESAAEGLEVFIKKHPESAMCHERLGFIYHDMKEYEKAIEHFDLAYALDKNNYYDAMYYKGKALMELKRYDEAVICYELCLLYFKLRADYHLRAAQCYEKLNLLQQALAHYRQAVAVDPDCKEAFDALQKIQKQK